MHFPFALYRVEGHSMEPTLRPNQRLLVKRGSKARPGDLIVFKKNAKTCVKRITEQRGDQFMVCGDHPESTDSRHYGGVHGEQILGRVLCGL